MKTSVFVNVSVRHYRRFLSKFGAFEHFVHSAVVSYSFLILACALINIFAPSFGSRNAKHFIARQFANGDSGQVSELEMSRCISKGLLGDTNDVMIRRVTAEFSCGCQLPAVYETYETPNVCAVIHASSRSISIPHVAKMIRSYSESIQEVIICEDSVSDRRFVEWAKALNGTRHFMIRSNGLHDTRCFNRALRMSSADFFILMQDNFLPKILDNPDAEVNWVSEALELFDADPKLGFLSGFVGQMWENGQGYVFGERNTSLSETKGSHMRRIPFLSKRTLKPFMYVECAWVGPLLVRSKALSRVGGFDLSLFPEGRPGVWHDCVLSSAGWASGWHVGVFHANFEYVEGGLDSSVSLKRIEFPIPDTVLNRYDTASVHRSVLDLNDVALTARY